MYVAVDVPHYLFNKYMRELERISKAFYTSISATCQHFKYYNLDFDRALIVIITSAIMSFMHFWLHVVVHLSGFYM